MLVGGKYKFVSKKGEGTFSEVIKAQASNSKFVAIKRMKNHFDSIEQVNNLREVQALKKLSPHPGIIKLIEVVFERSTGRLSLVFELMEMNIYELIKGRRHYLQEKKVKLYMYQLLKAIDHMHRNGIFHRDIKPENILLSEDKLKIADFGSCRGVKSKQPFTEYISTRWYRAPECLLTDGYYNYKMDMWGIGCVFFEVMSLFPLFPGTNELDQIQKIHNIIGTPPPDLLAKIKRSVHMNFNFTQKEGSGIDKLIPNAPSDCVDIIKKLLAYNPEERFSARQALRHAYFRELREGEKHLKHGSPMYNNIKPPTDHPDEASKKQAETTEKKSLGQLPQIKQFQHGNSITNITNINTNITHINTTNNIILNAHSTNPNSSTNNNNTYSTNPAASNSTTSTNNNSSLVAATFSGSAIGGGISHFGQSTTTHGQSTHLYHPTNVNSAHPLPLSHHPLPHPLPLHPLHPPRPLGSISESSLQTGATSSDATSSSVQSTSVSLSNLSLSKPSLSHSVGATSSGASSGATSSLHHKNASSGNLALPGKATNKSSSSLALPNRASLGGITNKSAKDLSSFSHVNPITHHTASSGDLITPINKKDLKRLPVLRPKPQDIEFILDKQKAPAPNNNNNAAQSNHAPLLPSHSSSSTIHSTNSGSILNPLPSIKGTGWKR